MAEMKGIKLCGECINYNWKTHKCKIGCNDDSNAQAPFYGDCPLPDVVPKSEVENLIYKLECLLCHSTGGMLSKYSYDFQTMESAVTDYINKVYYEGYDEAKAEVAREIFEEIERLLSMHFCSCLPKGATEHYDYYEGDLADAIAELKKKYTEVSK